MTESSVALASGSFAWTNTTSAGMSKSSAECDFWASAASNRTAPVGSSPGTSAAWTDSTYNSCNNTRAIYCFEQ